MVDEPKPNDDQPLYMGKRVSDLTDSELSDIRADNFDLQEISANLVNSVTDQVYRRFIPGLDGVYKAKRDKGLDTTPENDLEIDKKLVENIVSGIKDEITKRFVETLSVESKKELNEQYHPIGKVEIAADHVVRSVRWAALPLIFPIYVVLLVIAWMVFVEAFELVHLAQKYMSEVFATVAHQTGHSEGNKNVGMTSRTTLNLLVATVLSILDLILVASLVVMVAVGGFENTIARIGVKHNVPTWFGKLDISQLKIKVAASIVIISSIHLLMGFMQLSMDNQSVNEKALLWTAIIHAVFVASALALSYMEYVNHKAGDHINSKR